MQLSACTVLVPNNGTPDKLQCKNWYAHALALTTCLVHKFSQNPSQSTSLLHSSNLSMMQYVDFLKSIAGNFPEHAPAALGAFHAFLWPSTQGPSGVSTPENYWATSTRYEYIFGILSSSPVDWHPFWVIWLKGGVWVPGHRNARNVHK